MFTRNRDQAQTVDWGGGTSDRLLVEKDGMGFAVCHTIVKQGSSSKLEYRNHLEACYCVSGSGSVVEKDGTVHEITPGTIYVLDEHDPHELRGGEGAAAGLEEVGVRAGRRRAEHVRPLAQHPAVRGGLVRLGRLIVRLGAGQRQLRSRRREGGRELQGGVGRGEGGMETARAAGPSRAAG